MDEQTDERQASAGQVERPVRPKLRWFTREFSQTDETGLMCFAGAETVLQVQYGDEWVDVPYEGKETVHLGCHKWA